MIACDEETTVNKTNVLGKKGSNFLMMKEDMLDSGSDDDDVEDYKKSDVKYDNLGLLKRQNRMIVMMILKKKNQVMM